MREQTLGHRIQEGRKAAGLSQESLGERLGVSRQAVSKWEADTSVPELENLIAMSRIFGVTIGALLGVEPPAAEDRSEGDAPEAPGEGAGDAAPAGELTDRELAAVEAIVRKYLEAVRRPRWSRRRKIAGGAAACAAVLLIVLILNGIFSSLGRRLEQVQDQANYIQSSVSSQIGSLAGQFSNLLEAQNSIISGYDIRVADYSLEDRAWYLTASVTPREYTADTVVTFTARAGSGETSSSAPAQNEGGIFTVENWAVPMDEPPDVPGDFPIDPTDTTISVSFTGEDTVRTETLEALYWNLTDYRLAVDGRWETEWAAGRLTLGNLDLQIENNTELPVELADAELALFRHGEEEPLWSSPLEDAVELWRRQGYVQMYVPVETDVSPIRLNTGDALLAAVYVTDDHGQDYWSFVGCWRNQSGTLRHDSLYDLNDQYASSWQPGDLLPIWN